MNDCKYHLSLISKFESYFHCRNQGYSIVSYLFIQLIINVNLINEYQTNCHEHNDSICNLSQ